ncbi:hypothetical protein C5167_044699 [Papaver somniferum]|uniref:UDP-glycosyltransferase 79B8-like n=1 Tax=Papaver somniferum TaxID=3469 RepID=UPI000E70558B|nr:UDP-glycosyltransferase 79B8-like [Papaver somniferum]RZC90071.1 hypothetical protein C5167_044699 [Papaver somniferum]
MSTSNNSMNKTATFHAAMYPWFAMGHLTPFLHLSNKFAEKGNIVSFFSPRKTIPKLQKFNLHPNLITFYPLDVPHVDGLPHGAETMSDVHISIGDLLNKAFYLLKDHVHSLLIDLKPNFVFYDFASWIPSFTTPLGIKSIHHTVVSAASIAYLLVPSRELDSASLARMSSNGEDITNTELKLMGPPPGFPLNTPLMLHLHEVQTISSFVTRVDEFTGLSFFERLTNSMKACDLISIRTCREVEGPYCDYIETQYEKPVLLTGPALPEKLTEPLEEKLANWLGVFGPGSVLYCAFGSEWLLRKDQFQELVLGFELTEMPFLVALKPPIGCTTVEEALPEGFEERVRQRGVVHGGWVQQQQILAHPSVGCFVTHCGFGSMWEALMSHCQIVLMPQLGDQFLNTRILTGDLKVGVEVERREEDGWFTKESFSRLVKGVMDETNPVGIEIRENHNKLRERLSSNALENSYNDNLINKLHDFM